MSSVQRKWTEESYAVITETTAGSAPRHNELISFVRYQLGKMGARNEHHKFEDLCRALSRQRITRNIVTATGPVSAGGDQGRDFETFISFVGDSLQDVGIFLGIEQRELIAFCCTLQSSGLPSKIRADIEKIFDSPENAPSVIIYFTVADMSVAVRHRLADEVRGRWGARLEVIDGNSLSELLVDPECLWIATEYLSLSRDLLEPGRPADAVHELMLTGDIIVRPIESLDPIRDLGLHSPLQIDVWQGLPPYVARAVDGHLDELIGRGGLIVVEGNSASGKTRTAYEAVRRSMDKLGERPIIIPKDGVSLRKLISSGYQLGGSIIWLDDLERFIAPGGLDEGIIRLFGSDASVLFIATLRSRAKAAMSQAGGSTGRSVAAVYRAVMAGAKTVRVDRRLNKKERSRAYRLAADLRIRTALEMAESTGFAEYMAAAPSALERWQDGKDGANEIGAALISAAVDYRRAGYSSPIPRAWLEATFKAYLDSRIRNRVTVEDVEAGFSWAVDLIHGASSCLELMGDDMYSPFDYLVDYAQEQSERAPGKRSTFQSLANIPDDIWHELADRIQVDDPSFMSCVSMASLSPHPMLTYVYRHEILKGEFCADSLSDPGTLLNFARSCMNAGMCIACQAVRLQVDLVPMLKMLLEGFSSIPQGDEPTAVQIDCLSALFSMGENSNLEGRTSPLRVAAEKFSPDEWRKLGEFMVGNGMDFAGRQWIALADSMEGKRASWPVSLKKAEAFYIRGDWPDSTTPA
ncbi:hypothetical protein OG350_14005 [Streptomyces achromogenes]|uniref:ATP-binding protein n=1 Tax=Streptomyces achromogenes TaxID=67255 RepID=A0ABZ1KLD7_STRAH